MSRSYTALPFEYREELYSLSPAAFGKLILALLEFSETGKEPDDLPRAAAVFWPRLRARELAFQAEYEKRTESASEHGKTAANARWSRKKDGKMPGHARAYNTKTKTNTNTNTNTNSNSKSIFNDNSSGFIPGEAELEALMRLKRAKEERERKKREQETAEERNLPAPV